MRVINTPMRTMFRTLVTTLPVVCFTPVAVAQPVTEVWSQTYTGLERAYGRGVAVHNGSVYSAGVTLVAGGPPDMFFLKYDLAGTPVWERTWGGALSDTGGKIAPYGSHLYVSGASVSYADDRAGDLENDAITVKWSEDGVCDTTNSADCWWTRFSGDANYWGADSASNVAVDASGNLYVAGTSERAWKNPWAYVEQYNSAGVKQWHQHYGTSEVLHLSNYAGLALSGGNVFTTGRIDDGSGDNQLLVHKYTTAGASEWVFTWGDGSTGEHGSSIVVSGTDIYVAGSLGAPADPNGTDLLLVKLHDNGASASFVGSTTLTTTGNDTGTELKLVGGTLYIVGSIDVGGNTDSLLAGYDTDLNLLWDYSWGGTADGDDVAFDLAIHEGVIYVAGMENGYTEAYVSAFTGGMCGNGVVAGTEECDDGDGDNSDSCPDGDLGTCVAALCGDGFVWNTDGGTEECDDGDGDNSDSCPDGDLGTCVAAFCGDGFVWNTDGGTEECDDGNTDDNDGCSATCTVEAGWNCGSEPSICIPEGIPAVSDWGLIVILLLMLAGGTILIGRRRATDQGACI